MDLAMDLRGLRYRNFDELRVFCYRVASVVGLMMMHVIGFRGEPRRYAIDLGIALQLTNILRDVGEDLGRGRVYLPLEEIEAAGYTETQLMARVRNGNFIRLMEFQAARARQYYASAEPGIALLDKRGRFAVEVAARVYAGILRQIEKSGYDVFERRAVVPAAQKYWITARALALPAVRRYLPLSW
jgi:15-cis-phytoene synthase